MKTGYVVRAVEDEIVTSATPVKASIVSHRINIKTGKNLLPSTVTKLAEPVISRLRVRGLIIEEE